MRPARSHSAFVVAALVVATTARAQPQLTDSERRLVAVLQEDIPQILRLVGTPGLNLAIARRGGVIWEAGFGWADLERRIPMTASTVTHSGSMGKTYTATAVMQLVERGQLELDAPVNRYLGGWTITNPLGGREVTVRDLLTHRSGLAPNAAWSVRRAPTPLEAHLRRAYARERNDFYGGAASPTWSAKAGEKYQYSNLGIATLGYLVQVTNPERLSFSDYVQKHIIDPLGMRSTQYPPVQDSLHIRPEIWRRMSRGYAGFGTARIPTPEIYFEDHPAGTVVTVPRDHVRLLLAMMNGGTLGGYRLLAPETVRQMLTPYQQTGTDAEFEPSGVGLVWNLRDWNTEQRSFEHGGAHMWGWTNHFVAYPDLDLAIAVFMNQWSLPDDGQGARYREARLVIDLVRGWVSRERANTPRHLPVRSWAWKVSYVQGLMMVESTNGALGIAERFSRTDIDKMVRGAAPRADRYRTIQWDPAGFRAGVADLSAAELTPAGIAAFLASDRLQVLPEELPLIYLELGGRGNLTDTRPR
ncbi:MAG: beta-lactamase family protein [Gemmatimonadetes bacterium]|nr:beta-lactamase family protein [Gemmatimonadota bacterium]